MEIKSASEVTIGQTVYDADGSDPGKVIAVLSSGSIRVSFQDGDQLLNYNRHDLARGCLLTSDPFGE